MTTGNHYKTIVRRLFEEAINQDRFDVAEELIAPDFVNRGAPVGSDHAAGPRAFTSAAGTLKAPCPDLLFRVEDVIGEGDRAAVRWSARGTHTEEFRGALPTHRVVEQHGIDILRLEGGRVVEMWPMVDRLGVLQQLGILSALPPLTSASTTAERAG
jgi:predicted ester cyclase